MKAIRIPIRDLFLFSTYFCSENSLFLTIFSSFSMERVIEIKIFARLSFEQSGSHTFSIKNNWSIGERRDCLVVLYIHCRYHIKRKNPITYKKRSKTMTREWYTQQGSKRHFQPWRRIKFYEVFQCLTVLYFSSCYEISWSLLKSYEVHEVS